ncbi:hypothetical protein ES703_82369 [subsurface metagenome]
MIGKTGFLEAWRKGIEEWSAYENEPEKRGFYLTRKSQELYRPVGLKETDLGLQYGSTEAILDGFQRDMNKLIAGVVSEYSEAARKSGRKQDYNKLGIVYAQFLRYQQAEKAFQQALQVDSEYLSARINLANLSFLNKDYAAALSRYDEAYRSLESAGKGQSSKALKVLVNISRAYYQMENYGEAQTYFSKAQAIEPQQVEQYTYLA